MLEHKPIALDVKEMVPVDGGGWEVSGYASVWGGPPDAYGDVVVRGAFAESLASRTPKFLFQHRDPIGKTVAMHEDEHGLFGRFSIVDTAAGTDAYKLLKAGAVDGLSIGFVPVDTEINADGVRLLKAVDLFEVSAVAIPALDRALVTDVKSADAYLSAEERAQWTSSYVNSLPDSAFAIVLGGGSKDESGKTVPRDLRKLPHHNDSGSVDLPHLRNGLARLPQTDLSESQKAKAAAHLNRHAKAAGMGKSAPDDWPDHDHDHETHRAIHIGLELAARRLRSARILLESPT